MNHLKTIQVLSPDAIYLLDRVKMHLETYNDILPTETTKNILTELTELIEELKAE